MKKLKKLGQKIFIRKSYELAFPIESDPLVRNKKFQQIWKEDILINFKITETDFFDKNGINGIDNRRCFEFFRFGLVGLPVV